MAAAFVILARRDQCCQARPPGGTARPARPDCVCLAPSLIFSDHRVHVSPGWGGGSGVILGMCHLSFLYFAGTGGPCGVLAGVKFVRFVIHWLSVSHSFV